MKILLVTLALIFSAPIFAHDDPDANHNGGPCWIWEVPAYLYYCLAVDGDRYNHPRQELSTENHIHE